MSRRALILAIILLALPATALASWQAAGGNGRGYSKAQSIPAGQTPTATVSNRNVAVSWTAAGGSVPLDGYVVKRYANGGGVQSIGANCSGTVSGLNCTENNIPAGTWRYTVTPARGNWRGAESAQSTAVTVAQPSLSLFSSTATCLPETLSGQIQSFIPGQTVAFRLDNPTSGQLLSGSITPSPVPANGTASASVTIPAGVSDGSHTIYAVGSAGDVAGTPFTVNTSGIRVATGSYSGNGVDNRNVTGAGFQPDIVVIKGDTTGSLPSRVAVVRTSSMPSDTTKQLAEAFGTFSNAIQSFSATGFQVGNDARVNANGPTYYWTAIKAAAGHMAVGSYTGNGSSSQAISGLGFSPEYATVISGSIALNEQLPVQRMSTMTRTFPFDGGTTAIGGVSGTGITTGITSLDSGGFTVGNHASVNNNGGSHYYAAFNECAGETKVGSYTGNGTSNRAITGVGFQPAWVNVRANDTSTARQGLHRPASVPGSGSQHFSNTADITNGITALSSDGFSVTAPNTNGVAYSYLALHDKP